MGKLTTNLLNLSPDAYKRATTHPFLRYAGLSSLPKSALLAWLTQDRLYALNYVPFIGNLISKCSVPSSVDRTETLEWRITSMLIDALTNIRQELAMFEGILRTEFDWKKEEEEMRIETKAYADLFAGASAQNSSLLVGLTVLWATEKCYLEAWRYARSFLETAGNGAEKTALSAILIPNWSSPEFEKFVNVIGDLVDELAVREPIDSIELRKCEQAWRQVLWAEERFWPDVQE